MTDIERIIDDWDKGSILDEARMSDLAKAIEYYIKKALKNVEKAVDVTQIRLNEQHKEALLDARIDECEKAGWYWSECKDKRISELKAGKNK